MNVADSAKLAEVLDSAGYSPTLDIGQADIVLVNTCVVRQHAEDRAAWFITSMKNLKEKNPLLKIGLCGCFVTEPGRDFKKQFPHVDWFIGPNGAGELERCLGRKQRAESRKPNMLNNFVIITHGCDNYCSYCVVPYVRGREVSRPMDEVLAEIKGLLEQGVTDITLLGQNVNSYKYGLANLLQEINITLHSSLFTLHFTTSHPRDMSDEIIETVHALPYVAKEFHLPLQSGDNEILKRMNRGYTIEYYKERVRNIRSLMPQAMVTTDIMVGFPGETEAQFQNTLKAVREIGFREVHMFAYSPRPNTAASRMPDQLTDELKQARLHNLIELVRECVIISPDKK